MALRPERLAIRPLTARIGAEVVGVDPGLELAPALIDRLHAELPIARLMRRSPTHTV